MSGKSLRSNSNVLFIMGLVLSLALGVFVSFWGFILTMIYLMMTRPLHGAGSFPDGIYWIAPGVGVGVAVLGFVAAYKLTRGEWLGSD